MQTINAKLTTINYDSIIEKGIVFLLIFTPLAIGTVEDWSVAIMEIASFIIFGAWLLKSLTCEQTVPELKDQVVKFANRRLLISFVIVICIIIFQVIPLPRTLLSMLSPKTSSLYHAFIDEPGTWRPISIYPHASIDQLIRLLAYAAVFIVIVYHYNDEDKIKRLFRTVIYMGCFLAALAAFQKMFGNGKLLWVITMKPGLASFGPYINKNHFAGYMEMAGPIALAYCLYAASKIKEPSEGRESSRIKKLLSYLDNKKITTVSFAIIGVIIITGSLFITLSRGAIIGYVLSMLLFIWLCRMRRSLRKRTSFLVLMGGIVGLAVVVAGWNMVQTRFEKAPQEGAARIEVWQDSISLIRNYPILGTGLGTFDRIYPLYQTKYPDMYFEHPENEYIEFLTETGLIGFGSFFALVIVYFSSVLRKWRERHNTFVVSMTVGGISSCAAIMIHGLTDFNMRIPANAMLLTVIAAATYTGVFKVRSARENK